MKAGMICIQRANKGITDCNKLSVSFCCECALRGSVTNQRKILVTKISKSIHHFLENISPFLCFYLLNVLVIKLYNFGDNLLVLKIKFFLSIWNDRFKSLSKLLIWPPIGILPKIISLWRTGLAPFYYVREFSCNQLSSWREVGKIFVFTSSWMIKHFKCLIWSVSN